MSWSNTGDNSIEKLNNRITRVGCTTVNALTVFEDASNVKNKIINKIMYFLIIHSSIDKHSVVLFVQIHIHQSSETIKCTTVCKRRLSKHVFDERRCNDNNQWNRGKSRDLCFTNDKSKLILRVLSVEHAKNTVFYFSTRDAIVPVDSITSQELSLLNQTMFTEELSIFL